MIKRVLFATAAVVGLFAGSPALAHHSANAEFDTTKEFTITGTLTKLENVNPHSWWYVDVKDASGKVTAWKLESNAPAGFIRLGLKVKDQVKIGDSYSYRIAPAWKDPEGVKLGWMKALTVNGKEYVLVEL
jgi:hypothetical protein